jgi:uncharacterized protein (TIGR02466 family)
MDPTPKLLFATPLWIFHTENPKLLNKKLTLDGIQFKVSNWQYFDLPGEGIQELKKFVRSSAESAAKNYGIQFNKMSIRARQHVRKPLECDVPHHHPIVDLVGTYYLKTPDKCGDILLHDSRGFVLDTWQDRYVKSDNDDRNLLGQSGLITHRITPEEGKLILFPGYVTHSVETNLSDDMRISIVLEFKFE